MTLETERFATGGVLLRPAGELDIATAPALRERLTEAFDAGAERLVVGLTDVTFMDSVALAVLLQAGRRAGDGRMAIVIAPDSYAGLIFRIAGISHILTLVATRDEALAAVGA
jgi:anti-sigma B factor antagonist